MGQPQQHPAADTNLNQKNQMSGQSNQRNTLHAKSNSKHSATKNKFKSSNRKLSNVFASNHVVLQAPNGTGLKGTSVEAFKGSSQNQYCDTNSSQLKPNMVSDNLFNKSLGGQTSEK